MSINAGASLGGKGGDLTLQGGDGEVAGTAKLLAAETGKAVVSSVDGADSVAVSKGLVRIQIEVGEDSAGLEHAVHLLDQCGLVERVLVRYRMQHVEVRGHVGLEPVQGAHELARAPLGAAEDSACRYVSYMLNDFSNIVGCFFHVFAMMFVEKIVFD